MGEESFEQGPLTNRCSSDAFIFNPNEGKLCRYDIELRANRDAAEERKLICCDEENSVATSLFLIFRPHMSPISFTSRDVIQVR